MKLLASIIKEILLLCRDRAGMATLFIMPAFLVITITLIQEEVTTNTVDVLFINQDKGSAGKIFEELLKDSDTLNLVNSHNNEIISADSSKELVAAGIYQFAIVLPQGLTNSVEEHARVRVNSRLFDSKRPENLVPIPEIKIWFDPTVHGSFRGAVKTAISSSIQAVQMQFILKHTFDRLPEKISSELPARARSYMTEQTLNPKALLPDIHNIPPFISTKDQFATEMGFITQPTAVQQNVPAWAIFGLFFIAIPLAGSLIHERETGTLSRLKILPVSHFTVMTGKLLAYFFIGIVQFSLIILAGLYLLPAFGLPAFDPGHQFLPMALLVSAIIAAACGYGIFLGTLGKTYDQIALVGPVSIVIGAAIGGIMVPVYALPALIKPLSSLSPLYWGQSGFYDLLLREGGLPAILPELSLLLLFSLVGIGCSLLLSVRR